MQQRRVLMPAFTDWFPPAVVGVAFTFLASLKFYGMSRGVVGGGHKPWTQKCIGSCPTWSRQANIGIVVLFLVVGLASLAWAASAFW
jgi:protein involved in ribonucleotide reduction